MSTNTFAPKYVVAENGCWEWQGAISASGYGRTTKGKFAHRESYEYHKGIIDDNLVIDHTCENKICVNPEHLEAVSIAVNTVRGVERKGKKEWNNAGTPIRSFRLSDDLWYAARDKCIANGTTLTAVITSAIKDYLESENEQA